MSKKHKKHQPPVSPPTSTRPAGTAPADTAATRNAATGGVPARGGSPPERAAAPPRHPPAGPAAPAPAAPTAEELRRRQYLEEKLIRLIQQGRTPDALAQLDRLFPPVDPRRRVARWRWLLVRWPVRLAEELKQISAAALTETERQALCDWGLLLPEAVWEVLADWPEPWIAELACGRRALSALSAGHDEQAAAELRGIGLRSPLKTTRLFLKGLGAYYRREDDEAERSLALLAADPVYGAAARVLRELLTQPAGTAEPTLATRPAEALPTGAHALRLAFRGTVVAEQEQLQQIRLLLSEAKPNTALRELAQLSAARSPLLNLELRRDLPGFLQGLGLEPGAIAGRLHKALPPDPEDPQDHRLLALLYEDRQEELEAIDHWQAYLKDLEAGRLAWAPEEVPLVRAAIRRHQAQLELQVAKQVPPPEEDEPRFFWGDFDDDEDGEDEDWEDEDERRERWTEEHQQAALRHLQAAVQADPDDLGSWRALIALGQRVDFSAAQHKELDRLIERFVARFPEEPEVLVLAAEAAGQRQAFEKALRYIERAQALLPLDRGVRSRAAMLLLKKARKKRADGKLEDARLCYDEALALRPIEPEVRLKVLGELAAHHHLENADGPLLEVRDQALAEDPRPWLWTAYGLMGLHHLEQAESRRNRRRGRTAGAPPTRSPAPPDPIAFDTSDLRGQLALPFAGSSPPEPLFRLPNSPPTPAELSELLALEQEMRTLPGADHHRFLRLLHQALRLGHAALTTPEALQRAINVTYFDRQLRLSLAEQAARLFPDNIQFVCTRYEAAFQLDLPRTYFAQAEVELRRWLQDRQLPTRMLEDLEALTTFMSPNEILSAFQQMGFDQPEEIQLGLRVLSLLTRLAQLRNAGSPPRPKRGRPRGKRR